MGSVLRSQYLRGGFVGLMFGMSVAALFVLDRHLLPKTNLAYYCR